MADEASTEKPAVKALLPAVRDRWYTAGSRGSVAQWQSSRLIIDGSQVRILALLPARAPLGRPRQRAGSSYSPLRSGGPISYTEAEPGRKRSGLWAVSYISGQERNQL